MIDPEPIADLADELKVLRTQRRENFNLFGVAPVDARGPLTEDDFFAAARAAFKYGGPGKAMVLPAATLRRAQSDVVRLKWKREQAETAIHRLARGWRRFRLIARWKALRAYFEADRNYRSMYATFGDGA